MKRLFRSVIMLVILAIAFSGGATGDVQAQAPTPTVVQADPTPVDEAVKEAFQAAVLQDPTPVLGYLIYQVQVDRIDYSKDGSTALVWVKMVDRQTGQTVATEPGLVIENLRPNRSATSAESWQVTLQGASQYAQEVNALPTDLLDDAIRSVYAPIVGTAVQPVGTRTYTGYKLPWAAGQKKLITNAIGHIYTVSGGWTSCPTTCRYAFDFADGSMFPILAAKGGTVKAYSVTCPDNNHGCVNYMVLEDRSTNPITYQIYYHLKAESIPARFRTLGVQVNQGDYIANADNTGPSTGSHLHFHVYETANAANWSWGLSADIVFDEVTTNGGRPRTCAEAHELPQYGSQCMANDQYISSNVPTNLPSGTVTLPAQHDFVTSSTALVGGAGASSEGITRAQVLARWNGGNWAEIDSIAANTNGVFAKDVDVCAANIPDGPFDLKVQVYDRVGGQATAAPGAIHLIKNFACGNVSPPPRIACIPNSDQVSLYTESDYRGSCKVFDVRTTPYSAADLGSVRENAAVSVQVGANVRAVLADLNEDLTRTIPQGRFETLETNDANLSDNRIGAKKVSGLIVESRTLPPDEPFLTPPGLRWDGSGVTSRDSIVLAWNGGLGATRFDVNLSGTGVNLSWTGNPRANAIPVGMLTAGDYTWGVTAYNSAGHNNTSGSFHVTQSALPSASAHAFPYNDDMESGIGDWVATGLWRQDSVAVGGRPATHVWVYNQPLSSSYADATFRAGDLTSPPIAIPTDQPAYLTFQYFQDLADTTSDWDQRRVQVIDSAGKIADLYQFSNDQEMPQAFWQSAPPLNLAAYAGQTVRLRFHFDTIDSFYNNGTGWMIDNVHVGTEGNATGCADSGNASIASARAIGLGYTLTNAMICPQGDQDYYKFTGQAGQTIQISTQAQALGSALDTQVYLLDSDGQSVIAWNDDQVLGQNHDSLLTYSLQRTGLYYIKVKAWDYPGVGGSNDFYTFTLNQVQSQAPRAANLLFPTDPKKIPGVPFEVTVQAEDFNGGPVAKVDFYWHNGDWTNGDWVKVGTDSNGADGWSFILYPPIYGDVPGAALYVQAQSISGAVRGVALWDLAVDPTTPTSQLQPLPAQQSSPMIHLIWSAADPANHLDHFDIQYQESTDGSTFTGWVDWPLHPRGDLRHVWFNATPGHSYRFRMRAVNALGNQEDFPGAAQAATTLQTGCTPDGYDGQDATQSGAVDLPFGQQQLHTLCQNDVDWVKFQVPNNIHPLILIHSVKGGTAVHVNLYDSVGKLVTTFDSIAVGSDAMDWADTLPAGTYFMEIRALQPNLFGSDVQYAVSVTAGSNRIILPFIPR